MSKIKFRFEGPATSGAIGLLTELLETPKIAKEVPWWLMFIITAVVAILAGFVPEKREKLASMMDALVAGLSNVSRGMLRDDKDSSTAAQILNLQNQLKALQEP